jgi:2-polyprenyl-6-methoxyphenol hydroxylase-like FAD-dependent oxidoreductase
MSQSVLISGAGIAGPALAYWCVRFGLKPTIVERAPGPRSSGYIIDFWGCGYDVAERMGLRDELMRAGYDVRELRLVDSVGKRKGGFGVDVLREIAAGRYTSLLRGDLSAILNRAIERDVEVRYGDSIRALDQDSLGVTVTFEHAGPQRFDAVVGADGLHSNVRALAFRAESTYERYLGYIAAAVAIDGYRPRDEGVYVSFGAPRRQVARFAMREDRTMFLFVVADEGARAFEPRDASASQAYLRARFGTLGWECPAILSALRERSDIYCDRVSQIRAPRWSKGRIALLGDAAAAPSLLAGQGASLAITSAYVLAGELAKATRPEIAFARYEALLRPFIVRKQQSALGVGRAFAPETRLGLSLRNLATRAFKVPGLAKRVLAPALRDDFDLPHYDVPRLQEHIRADGSHP